MKVLKPAPRPSLKARAWILAYNVAATCRAPLFILEWLDDRSWEIMMRDRLKAARGEK